MNKPYTKAMQLMKNRLKPKVSQKNKPKITQDEKEYLNWLDQMRGSIPCVICNTFKNIEYHHVKNRSTDKKDHKRLIALCMDHHRYNKLSPHNGPRLFRSTYPVEVQNKIADELYQRYLVLKDLD